MDGGWLAALPAGPEAIVWGAALAVAAALVRSRLGRVGFGAPLLVVLHALEATFLAALLAAMLALSFLQIVLRNVAHTGWVWLDPLLRHLLLWIGFVGAMLATRMDQHINVDALSRLLGKGPRRVVHAATSLAAATVCLFLAEACLAFIRDEAGARTTGFLGVPTWCLLVVMPVALWIMSARFVRIAFDAAHGTLPPPARVGIQAVGDAGAGAETPA